MVEDNARIHRKTRRNTLRLLAASGVGMVGATGSAAAVGKRESQQEDEEVTIAEGTAGYVTSNEETPDWFTLKSAGDAKWDIGDLNKKQGGKVGIHDHLDCDGDQLDWGGTIERWGLEFTLHLDHCAGTCNWDFQIEALGQKYSGGMDDDCDGEETISIGVHPLRIDAVANAHASGSLPIRIEYWDIEISIEYYDPRSGWESDMWSFEIENPLA